MLPPAVGLIWTPGYWGYEGERYIWHAGYWGPHVGYYGGINYGLGYFGSGYQGGYWEDGVFFYNTAVTRVDTTVITNTYNKQVISTATANNVGFNGPGRYYCSTNGSRSGLVSRTTHSAHGTSGEASAHRER